MALLFCDGFDHYSTEDILQKWDALAPFSFEPISITTPGRNTSFTYNAYLALTVSSTLSKGLPNSTTLTAGFAFNPDALIDRQICGFSDQLTAQVSVYLTSDGALQAQNGDGTVLGTTSSGILASGTFSFIEVQVAFSTTSGSVNVQLDGSSVLSVSGVVTATSSNAYANIFTLFGTGDFGAAFGYDDVYICDDTGPHNTTFLGNTSVALAIPNGNGVFNNWARTGGTSSGNYTAVDEVPPDGDTSYVASSTPGQADAYAISSIGTVSAIYAVQVVGSIRKTAGGIKLVGLGIGNASAFAFDSGHPVSNSYEMYRGVFNNNPFTNAAWGTSDLSAAQIAVKVLV